MNVSEIRRVPSPEPEVADDGRAAESYPRCEECGTAVEETQRYCVHCGAHRRHVPDPAARYLSEASARARRVSRVSGTAAARRRSGRRTASLRRVLAIAVVLVAVAVGVAIGHGTATGSNPSSTHSAGTTVASHSGKGAAVAKKIQRSTGTNYVKSQSSLPGTVTVP